MFVITYLFCIRFLARDTMHKRDLCRRATFVSLASVCHAHVLCETAKDTAIIAMECKK